MLETLLGGVFGGLLRVVPEFLKWLDRKGEREHELKMMDRQLEFEKFRISGKLAEIEAAGRAVFDKAALGALREAVKAQGMVTAGFAGLLSASVRPVITYAFFTIWAAIKIGAFVTAMELGATWITALGAVWTEADQALWAGILNFWFMGRVFEKVLR
jgi:hypothetical protein